MNLSFEQSIDSGCYFVFLYIMKISYIFLHCVPFLSIWQPSYLYNCDNKKLNSISDSLLSFFYLRLSLSQAIYKRVTQYAMMLLCSNLAFFTPILPSPNVYLIFYIFSISYCHVCLGYYFVLLFLWLQMLRTNEYEHICLQCILKHPSLAYNYNFLHEGG